MSPLDNLSPWNDGRNYEPFEPQPVKKQERRFGAVLWVLILIGALCLVWAVTAAVARAHSPDHPEMNSWLMAQESQQGLVCCNGDDVVALDDSSWRITGDAEKGDKHYEAFYQGKWWPIDQKMLIKGHNQMPTALLWWYANAPRCFAPATFY